MYSAKHPFDFAKLFFPQVLKDLFHDGQTESHPFGQFTQ